MESIAHDVVIVGAGPAGLSCALALAQAGFSVALIESRPHPAFNENDPRWWALSADTLAWLHALGLTVPCALVETVHLSYAESPHLMSFSAQEGGLSSLGGVTASVHLWKALYQQVLLHSKQITLIQPDSVLGWSWKGSKWHLTLASLQSLEAPLVIGADGGRSSVRAFFGPSFHQWTLPQKAVVFTFTPFESTTAYEHFFQGGSLALLPCFQQRGAGVWIGKPQALPQLDLQQEVHHFLEAYGPPPHLLQTSQAFEVNVGFSSSITFPRCVLIGDAAQVIHPIAGQGLNVGLRGIQDLVAFLCERRRLGLDWGLMLKSFEKQWRRKAFPLQLFTASVVLGFSLNRSPRLWKASAWGMKTFPFLRQWISHKASFPHGRSTS